MRTVEIVSSVVNPHLKTTVTNGDRPMSECLSVRMTSSTRHQHFRVVGLSAAAKTADRQRRTEDFRLWATHKSGLSAIHTRMYK